MRLVYKFNNYKHNEELFRMCRFSKDLYNQTMYFILLKQISKMINSFSIMIWTKFSK